MSWHKWKIVGIAPEVKHVFEQSEALEQERKIARESLVSVYDKNIATRLKSEVNNYDNNRKDALH